ncbi:MAG: hypothetical protein GX267_05170 [Fibrobacter sp.]|jgi:hypothetical protein|nr:hypothetical protein [Fibrobacter sp.]
MVKKEMWTPEETSFLNAACEKLAQSGMVDLYKKLDENLVALEHQANALALYPSILDSNRLGGTERNLETLVSALSDRYREEDVFVLPTKAILGRSYEIGKINIFYMLKRISVLLPKNIDILGGEDPLSFVMNRMLSIMTEDVLLDLLSDNVFKAAKPVAAKALAEIWERRISADSISFNPELRKMWLIRQSSVPIFGTLMGTHEYIALCKQADDVCLKYIMHSSDVPDEASALEEFLFGLNYEELCDIKKTMASSGKTCIDRDEVKKIIGNDRLFFFDSSGDPLELYRFFNHRRKQALSRRHAGMRGPIRTFEENFMAFLLLEKDALKRRSLPKAKNSCESQVKED